MKILNTKNLAVGDILSKLSCQRSKSNDVKDVVLKILEKVRREGDKALFEFTEKFDRVRCENFVVSKDEIDRAYELIDKDLFEAIKFAKRNIEKFHDKILCRKEAVVRTVPGVKVWREFRPIEKVGLYVPGGKAPYFSTVLMLGVPAMIAGCREIVMCTPVLADAKVNPAILVAADLCGIKKIYKLGGAQAIAAMAYGTETVPRVYKIFGPGNQYVSTAKMMVYGEVDIDMPAGPSELMVIADGKANVSWVAADLLSQLEHGPDSQVCLITFGKKFAEKVVIEMREQMRCLRRTEIIKQSFVRSFAVVARSIEEACFLTNEYAPEHLEIIVDEPENVLDDIINVGSVFLGPYASEPLGDYVTGSNHTLPTSGFARMFGPLSTDSFGRMIQVQQVSIAGLKYLTKSAQIMAEKEGLDAHKMAVSIRLK